MMIRRSVRIFWHLLEILLRNPGKLVSQRQLLHSVRGPSYTNQTHYLRQYMAQVRRKPETRVFVAVPTRT